MSTSNKSPEQVIETCRRAAEAAKAIITADGFSGVISISTIDDFGRYGTGSLVVCGLSADVARVTGCKAQAKSLLELVIQTAEMLGTDPKDHFRDTMNGAIELNIVDEIRGESDGGE